MSLILRSKRGNAVQTIPIEKAGFSIFFWKMLPPGLLIFISLLYLSTLCPTCYWYDSAEFPVAAHFLGICHPTGYPMYMMLGKYISFFSPADPARAMNALSLLFILFTFLSYIRLLEKLNISPLPICIGLAIFAGSPVVWSASVVAEVYSFNLLLLLGVILLEWTWVRSADIRYGFAVSFLFGLGLGHHLTLIFTGPVLFLNRLIITRKSRRGGLGISLHMILFLLGLSIYLYLPVRAVVNPFFNVGDPDTISEFWRVIRGGEFYKYFLPTKPTSFEYSLLKPMVILWEQLLPGGMVLGIFGLIITYVKKVSCRGLLLCIAVLNSIFVVFYKVQDIEYFSSPLLLVFVIWISIGLHHLGEVSLLAGGKPVFKSAVVKKQSRPIMVIYTIFLLTCTGQLFFLRRDMDLHRFNGAMEYVESIFEVVPENAFLINKMTPVDWYYIAPIWYAKYVLKQRQDLNLYDDMSYWKLHRSNPPSPAFVLHDDPVLQGRYRGIPHKPIFELIPRSLPLPAERSDKNSVMLNMGSYNNADYRHDPFNPNPEIGKSTFYPHLLPGVLHWNGIPFHIMKPYEESQIPSVLTTCFQKSLSLTIPLVQKPIKSLWFLMDGGIQKHVSIKVARLEVEMDDGTIVKRDIYSFRDVWEYFNHKNDYPVPKERLAYGECENASLSVFGFELPEGKIPKTLTIKNGDNTPEDNWYPGITIFAITQILEMTQLQPGRTFSENVEDNYHIVDISPYTNADYDHNPFAANPEAGQSLFPDLLSGLLFSENIPFLIMEPYNVTTKPSLININKAFLREINVPLSPRNTDSVYLALTAFYEPGLKHSQVNCEIKYSDGTKVENELVPDNTVWNTWEVSGKPIPADRILWGDGQGQTIQLLKFDCDDRKIPVHFKIKLEPERPGRFDLAIFAITQKLVRR